MSITPVVNQPPPPRSTTPASSGPAAAEQPKETWFELLVRIAQFARFPELSLPKPNGGNAGSVSFVLRMLTIDLVLRIGTVPILLFGSWLLNGAEYTALDVPEGQELNKVAIFVLAAVVAPLLEETAMRLQIHRFSEWRFWLSTIVWMLFVGLNAWDTTGILWLPAVFPAGFILWRLVAAGRGQTESWNNSPRLVLWSVTLGFALMHLSNYEIPATSWRLVAAVLLVFPQLLGGLLMAYTRVRVGFWGSVAHHAISNGLLIALVLPSL